MRILSLKWSIVVFASLVSAACGGGSTTRTSTSGTSPNGLGSTTASGTSTSTETSTTTADQVVTNTVDGKSYTIFKYEAFVTDGKAHSAAGVQPTVSVSFDDAKKACEAAGYRMCTQSEWQAACKGPENLMFAYAADQNGPPKVEVACDVARTTDNSPGSLPSKTGSHTQCVTKGLEIYDMIGNASEWGYNSKGEPFALGVAFYQDAKDSHCEGGLNTGPEERSTDMGFRCCK